MDAYDMMERIADTLSEGEVVPILVTRARGLTLVEHYEVSKVEPRIRYIKHSWNKSGTVRREYAKRVLGKTHTFFD